MLLNWVSLLLASSVVAVPTSKGSSVVEKLSGPPAGWVRDESARIDKDGLQVRLRINLVQQDMQKFHELATNVSFSLECGEKSDVSRLRHLGMNCMAVIFHSRLSMR